MKLERQGGKISFRGRLASELLSGKSLLAKNFDAVEVKGEVLENSSTALAVRGTAKVLGEIRGKPLGGAFLLKLNKDWNAELLCAAELPKVGSCQGRFTGSFADKAGTFKIANRCSVDLSKWFEFQIDPDDFVVSGFISSDGVVSGSYDLSLAKNSHSSIRHSSSSHLSQKKKKLRGSFFKGNEFFAVSGVSGTYSFNSQVDLDSKSLTKFIVMQNGIKKAGLSSSDVEPSGFDGFVDFELLKRLLPFGVARGIVGEKGRLNVHFRFDDAWENITGKVDLSSALLMPRSGCNPVRSLTGEFNFHNKNRQLVCRDVDVQYSTGSLFIPQLTYQWDEAGNLSWLHFPANLERCLIHRRSDLYAIASGALVFRKKFKEMASLKGNLILHQSCYQGNGLDDGPLPAFLEVNRASKSGDGIKLDIGLISQDPAFVNASFFEAKLNLDFRVNAIYCADRLLNIRVDGSARVCDGTVKILNNHLKIIRGDIKFSPNRTDDPIVDIVARGRIKKYEVTLHVAGSAQDPYVTCSSYPELRDEQVMSLLLSGKDNVSLSQMLPGLVVSHLGNIAQGGKHGGVRFGKFMRAVTRPLRQLKLIPHFSDPEQGGLGASVDLELSPRLHASLRKGLRRSDDLAVQMEYFLTDNLSFKLAREAHGDVGGELEMRVKF
jgi:hypothetical protein